MKLMGLNLEVPSKTHMVSGGAVVTFVAMVAALLHNLGMEGPLALGIAAVGVLCALLQTPAIALRKQRGAVLLMAVGGALWWVIEALMSQ